MLTVGQDTAGGVGGSGVCGVVGALALASADWYWCPRHSWAPAPHRVLFLDWWCQPGSHHHHHHTTHTLYCTLYTLNTLYRTLHTLNTLYCTLYTPNTLYWTTCNISYIEHCIQQTKHPVCCTHTGLGRQDILILDTGHHGKTDNLRTLSEVTWHIFAMCSITEHPCAEDNTVWGGNGLTFTMYPVCVHVSRPTAQTNWAPTPGTAFISAAANIFIIFTLGCLQRDCRLQWGEERWAPWLVGSSTSGSDQDQDHLSCLSSLLSYNS